MFNFIKTKLQKVYQTFSSSLQIFFNRTTIDENALKELEIILISADTGVKTTRHIIQELRKVYKNNAPHNLPSILSTILTDILHISGNWNSHNTRVFLLVGINGSGKTTCASKLAHTYKQQGKRVLLVAADTFRAAAQDQLAQWAEIIGVDVVVGKPQQDPASVVFTGCQTFKNGLYDILIIDTAGRLQTKINLMHELGKIKRIINKQLPAESIQTLLTIDAMLGQNSFEQARIFKESTDVTGIIMTKMDGTGKGGIIFSIAQELTIPIAYLSVGEKPHSFFLFDPSSFIKDLLEL